MSETKVRKKAAVTPRQAEIKRLIDKGRDKRTDQESARLDQLKEEEKRDRFMRLAPKRVTNAIKAIVNVGRLGNKTIYEFTEDEAARVTAAIYTAAERMGEEFRPKKRDADVFTL